MSFSLIQANVGGESADLTALPVQRGLDLWLNRKLEVMDLKSTFQLDRRTQCATENQMKAEAVCWMGDSPRFPTPYGILLENAVLDPDAKNAFHQSHKRRHLT